MTPPMFPDAPPLLVASGKGVEALLSAAEEIEQPDASTGDLAERLVRRFLTLCENPRTRAGMLRLVKGSVASAKAAQRFYRVVNGTVLNPLARASGVHASALKWELVSAQLVGLAMMRYVLEIEPAASAPVDELVRAYAPAIRATLKSG